MKNQTKYVLTGGLILVAYAILVVNPGLIGLPANAAQDMYTLFPSIFVLIITVYALKESKGLGKVASGIGVGFGVAYLIDATNTLGLITAEILHGLTVYQLQLWAMVLGTVGGACAYKLSK